jgi:PAS domain S-box-containing protein
VQVNAAAAHMTGYSETELLTLRVLDTLPPEAHAAGGAHFQQLATFGQASNELPFRRKDGSIGFWLVDAVKLSPTRFLGFTVDTTARKQAEVAVQSSLREKEALLKEVHHRVKNNLQVIMSLLRLESRRSAQADTRSVLHDMQDRIRSMALLHESLYRSGTFAAVDLGSYLHQLANQSFRSLVTTPSPIRLHLDLGSVFVEMDQALPCGLLVNELLSNALKHGFPPGVAGEVRVELQPVDGGPQWRLRVSDNGIGLPADFETRRGQSLGLQLVSDHVSQIHGHLEVGPLPTAIFSVNFTVGPTRPPSLP